MSSLLLPVSPFPAGAGNWVWKWPVQDKGSPRGNRSDLAEPGFCFQAKLCLWGSMHMPRGSCTSSSVHTPSQTRAMKSLHSTPEAPHTRWRRIQSQPNGVAQLKTPTQIMDGCQQPKLHQKMPRAPLASACEQLNRPCSNSAVVGDGQGHSLDTTE